MEGYLTVEVNTKPVAPATGSITKCAHGSYIVPGETTARYCTMCNPEVNRVIAPAKQQRNYHIPAERVLDATEYSGLSVGARLAQCGIVED